VGGGERGVPKAKVVRSNRIGGADRQGREEQRKRQSLPLLCLVRNSERQPTERDGVRRRKTSRPRRSVGREIVCRASSPRSECRKPSLRSRSCRTVRSDCTARIRRPRGNDRRAPPPGCARWSCIALRGALLVLRDPAGGPLPPARLTRCPIPALLASGRARVRSRVRTRDCLTRAALFVSTLFPFSLLSLATQSVLAAEPDAEAPAPAPPRFLFTVGYAF
jgi:hypothetical protein